MIEYRLYARQSGNMMRRVEIRMDEATYALAQQRASAEGISFAAFVRELIKKQIDDKVRPNTITSQLKLVPHKSHTLKLSESVNQRGLLE